MERLIALLYNQGVIKVLLDLMILTNMRKEKTGHRFILQKILAL